MRPACEWRLPALPVLTYFKFSETTILDSARSESRPTRRGTRSSRLMAAADPLRHSSIVPKRERPRQLSRSW
ncbi:hypothetical protein EN852_019110 [Mesorhizobium sp. M2E.F.Ca.ET.209.01.1.1]|nr:hypothetical protein EN852_019110 [Mesorhizobium sp. M2E.F.Ca.ET.209.01.1.1]